MSCPQCVDVCIQKPCLIVSWVAAAAHLHTLNTDIRELPTISQGIWLCHDFIAVAMVQQEDFLSLSLSFSLELSVDQCSRDPVHLLSCIRVDITHLIYKPWLTAVPGPQENSRGLQKPRGRKRGTNSTIYIREKTGTSNRRLKLPLISFGSIVVTM